MMLARKVALVYGAGGPIGGAAARAFAREGASLFLAGRTGSKVELVANDIRQAGGEATATELDALDEKAVDAWVDTIARQTGQIDISMNVIGYGDVQQPLAEITTADFLQPIVNSIQTQFLTTRAAVRHMAQQGSGVVITFGGGGPQTLPGLGGFKIALDAIEGHRRQWACEAGEHGIRFVTIKTGGIPETISEAFEWRDAITESIVGQTLLKRAATLEDVGNVSVFIASDHARTITSTEINISCGSMVD